MGRLGDDEFISIFNKIDNELDRKSFSQASKHFMRVACISLRKLHNSYPDMLYDIVPESSKLVSFRCNKPLLNNHIKLLAYSCPNLSELWLGLHKDSDHFDFNDDGLRALANSCSNLSRVELSGRSHVGDVGIYSLITSSKNLTRLYLGGCVRVTDESLKAIGESSSLVVLKLRGCYMITDLGLKYLVKENVKNCLTHLDLGGCDRITDNGIINLKQMVSLKCLVLSKCGVDISDTGVTALLSQLPNIEILDLSWLINVTDISLFVIAGRCLKLTIICLKGCEAITCEGLCAFAHHPRLDIMKYALLRFIP